MSDDLAEFYAHLRGMVPLPIDHGDGFRDSPAWAEILRLLLDRTETLERRLLTLERAAGPWDERVRRLHPVTGAVMAAVTSDGDLRKFTLYGPDHPAGWSVTGFYTYGAAQDAADKNMRGRGWTLVGEP